MCGSFPIYYEREEVSSLNSKKSKSLPSTPVSLVLAIVTFGALATGCGFMGFGTKSVDTSNSSEISVVFAGLDAPCTTPAQNYAIDLQGQHSWTLTVRAKQTSGFGSNSGCKDKTASLGIISAAGNGGVVTGARCEMSESCDFDVQLIAGSYQILVDNQPTQVLITVYDSSKGGAPPTTAAPSTTTPK